MLKQLRIDDEVITLMALVLIVVATMSCAFGVTLVCRVGIL